MEHRARTDALHHRTLDKIKQLETLAAAVRSPRPLDAVIQLVIKQISDVVPADATAVWLFDADNDRWYIGGTRGFTRRTSELSFKSSQTLHASVAEEGEVVTNLKSRGFRRVYPEHELIQCALYAPMKIAGRRVGLISLYRNTDVGFSDDDLRFVRTVGSQLGMAISFAALEARAERAAVLEERARFGADLHDGILQILSSVRVYAKEVRSSLDAARESLDDQSAAGVYAALARLDDCVDSGSDEIVLAIRNLRQPEALREVRRHLEATADRLRKVGIATELSCEIDEIPPEVSDALSWIAREAVSNILQHSLATQVSIRVQTVGAEIELIVSDDGVGAHHTRDRGMVLDDRHLGRRIMRERAAHIGGTLQMSSGNNGTTIRARMPLVPPAAGDPAAGRADRR